MDVLNRKRHMTLIMVSHAIREAVEHADHILHLSQEGSFFGTTQEYENSGVRKEISGRGGRTPMTEMLSYLGEMLTYPFMQRAFVAGILISICASLWA